MNINDIEEIKKIAKAAGGEILKYYNSDFNVAYKDGNPKSPVTDADLASDKIIKEGLVKYHFPILSEESADDKSRLNSEYVWIVDPLDGTSDFIGKAGEFSVCIGLVQKGEPILGVMYEPVFGRMSFAQKNQGSFLEKNGEKIKLRVSKEAYYDKMTILVSRHHLMPDELKLIEKLKIGNKITRGSVAKITVIAEGQAHIYINSSDKSSEWDTCAGALIIKEAGGKITDMDGNDLVYNNENPRHLRGYVVSNGTRHNDIIKALKSMPGSEN